MGGEAKALCLGGWSKLVKNIKNIKKKNFFSKYLGPK